MSEHVLCVVSVCGVWRTCSRGPLPPLELGGVSLGLPWGRPAALPAGAAEVFAGLMPLCLRALLGP